MKIAIIIQARSTSHRFPNKVMKLLNHKYVLYHVIENCGSAGKQIIVAIPESTSNDKLAHWLDQTNTTCYRGDENDVLSRLYHCAVLYDLDVIIRVCGDTPFIKSQDIRDNMMKFMGEDRKRMIYGNGSWIFTFEMLQQAYIRETESRDDVCRSMTNSVDYESDIKRLQCLV